MKPKMIIVLPWLYEFGGELLKMVPGVQRLAQQTMDVVVYHERGKECLYPNVPAMAIDPPRRGSIKNIRDNPIYDGIKKEWPKARFITPYNFFSTPMRFHYFQPKVPNLKFKVDVVLFPRRKSGAANWTLGNWQALADYLNGRGLKVFAAGIPEQSWKLDGCRCAWDYGNPLESSIHAIYNSNVRVGPITGLQVLSLMCGKSTYLMVSEIGTKGVGTMEKPNLTYLETVDHLRVGWTPLPFMFNPKLMAETVYNFHLSAVQKEGLSKCT